MIPLAFLRTRTGQIIAGVVVALIAFAVWLHFHDRRVVQRQADKQQAHAAPANAKAEADRSETTKILANDSQQVKDALAPLPDAPLTDRQRVRACTVWLQQHPGANPPAPCRPVPDR